MIVCNKYFLMNKEGEILCFFKEKESKLNVYLPKDDNKNTSYFQNKIMDILWDNGIITEDNVVSIYEDNTVVKESRDRQSITTGAPLVRNFLFARV